jgi:MtN3 and saliva related transmembrane protein
LSADNRERCVALSAPQQVSEAAMAIEISNLVGAVASVASVSSFAPQAWKVIRTRDTRSISATMYWLTLVGFGLWFVFGILVGQWPLIVTNAICFALSAFILVMKVLPPSKKHAVANAIVPESQDE